MRFAGTGKWFLAIGLGLAGAATGTAAETLLLRYPDIHGNRLVFCHGGDVYLSSIEGGQAQRLTDFTGEEILPKFSPNGRQIAFTAEVEGNKDIYIVPVSGGKPRRLTFHPADEWVVDWHPDGERVVFRSNASSASYRVNRLHVVPAGGGLVQVLELPEADLAGFNDAGDKVAFCPTRVDLPVQGYRGGAAPEIWTYDFASRTSDRIIADGSFNSYPIWTGDRVYFVSDRGDDRVPNLWVRDLGAGTSRPLTGFKEWPVRWPSRGGDRIVFENGGRLHLLDIHTGTMRRVRIEIPGFQGLPMTTEINVESLVSGAPALSPDGRKVILSARGDLFLLEPGRDLTRNLTRSSGAYERYPQWDPQGGRYAFVSDATGEDQIYIGWDEGDREAEQVSRCEAGRIGAISWSPDGRKIGFADHRAAYNILDLETGAAKKVFFNAYQGSVPFATAAWSPDSRWLTYTLGNPNWLGSVYLYSLDQDRAFRVTDGSVNASNPQFDTDGRYLYWISDVRVNVEDSFWDGEHHLIDPSTIVAATLGREAMSPFAPGMENAEPTAGTAGSSPLRIDVEGLADRAVALPVPDSSYGSLRAVAGGLIYSSSPARGDACFKLFDQASKKETVLSRDAFFLVPAARSATAAYRGDSGIGILGLKAARNPGDGRLDLSGLRLSLDRRQEWVQIFREAWRIVRDFFYDERMRGVDWPAVRQKYEVLLPHVASREELNHLLEEMFAEIGHSHLEISGGDSPNRIDRDHGLLGVDLMMDPDSRFYQIARVYRGRSGDRDSTGPLAFPGLNVREGDYLLAIDGHPLKEGINPDAFLVDKAGRDVVLTIHSLPTLEGARRLTVRPAAYSEREGDLLRYADWVSRNRDAVDKESGGRIGYLHLPDTYTSGIAAFFRQAPAELHKEGLILDVRFNSGGYTPVWMLERLNRKMIFRSSLPYGKASISEPDPVFCGIKACLINESVESSGETFAAIFRQWDIGPIIGRRTAGRLASTGGMRLIDGGVLVYPAEGKGTIENEGISPDIEVLNRPEETGAGIDRQLQRAVAELLKRLPDKLNR
jgi:tricorn protease